MIGTAAVIAAATAARTISPQLITQWVSTQDIEDGLWDLGDGVYSFEVVDTMMSDDYVLLQYNGGSAMVGTWGKPGWILGADTTKTEWVAQ